jgi:hypothetical protein
VAAVTSGSDVDPDGYTVSVDGAAAGVVNGTSPVTVSGLVVGDHAVELSGIADNCEVQGDNPRQVTISSGENASVSFTIVCAPPAAGAGTIQVAITTSGADPDPDGYVVTLDGGGSGIPIPASGSATFPNVPVGSHSVALSGLASNCTVTGGTTASTTVSSGTISQVSFTVACTAAPPTVGLLRITTTTTGPDQDGDGYRFAVDGGQTQVIGVSAQVDLANTAAGAHAVVLSNVAENCRVDDASKTVTVTAGATATVAFSITCTAIPPAAGSIRVTTSTSGPNPDPDGYQFAVDGGAASAIGVNGTATVTEVPTGSHRVVLSGVAENCTIAGGASKNVTVSGGQTAEVAFAVTCAAPGPSASRSTMAANPTSIPAGGSSTITVTVRDAGGAPVEGVPVTLTARGSGNTITPESATSAANGVATFTFSSTVAETKSITAKAAGITLNDTEEITVFQRGSSTEITTITPEPSTAGEMITVTVKVTGEGGGIPTGTVAIFSLQETGGCDDAALNAEGIATCEFPLDVVGTQTIEAMYSGDDQFEDSAAPGQPHEVVAPAGANQRAAK